MTQPSELKKIKKEDWDLLTEQAVNYTNASAEDDLDLQNKFLRSIHKTLDHLEEKYGENDYILATRADYTECIQQKEYMLLRAYEISDKSSLSSLLTISSLLDLYIDSKVKEKSQKWLEKFEDVLKLCPDEYEITNLDRFKKAIERLESA